ncbi:sugar kinase [Streptomyces sulfonofaciens]
MVTFLPREPGGLADVASFERGIGGAESNVACGVAGAGHSAKWVGRVGADGFGQHLVERIASYGVDTGDVQYDPHRPTGIYFRTAGERALSRSAPAVPARQGPPAAPFAEVVYYRAGSAASAMSPANMPGDVLRSGRILHLTGITAALSADCLALLDDLTAPGTGPGGRAGGHRPLLSFDVNYRVGLWRDAERAGTTLLGLGRRCDLVFVGEDEAEAAWGVTGGPAAVRAVLPEPRTLVVKQGATGATVFHRAALGVHRPDAVRRPGTADSSGTADSPGAADNPCGGASAESAPVRDTVTFVPALRVDVVAEVGAGDAFAAGFLSGTLRGLPLRDRIRHGHLMAAAALTVAGDLGPPPGRPRADRLAALDEAAWGRLRLGPGWTEALDAPGTGLPGRDAGADEEVPAP